jgi:hypothetical protein
MSRQLLAQFASGRSAHSYNHSMREDAMARHPVLFSMVLLEAYRVLKSRCWEARYEDWPALHWFTPENLLALREETLALVDELEDALE